MHRSLSLGLILIAFSACTKEGKTGPQGPAGNANVKSVNFDVQKNDWRYQAGSAYLEHSIGEITADIYNKGSVNVYWHANNNWVALPTTYPKDSITQSVGYDYNTGKLRVFVTNSNGKTPDSLGTATFRAVIIAGT